MKRWMFLFVVVPPCVCGIAFAAGCGTNVSAEHNAPKPSAIIYVDSAGQSVSLDEGGSAYAAARDVLDSLAEQPIEGSGIWPENAASIAGPRSDAELIEALTGQSMGEVMLQFVFPQGTWMAFHGDESAIATGATENARSGMGTPLRAEGDGTAYHIRSLRLNVEPMEDGRHAFDIYAEGSEPLRDGSYYSGTYLQSADSEVGESVRMFLDAVDD